MSAESLPSFDEHIVPAGEALKEPQLGYLKYAVSLAKRLITESRPVLSADEQRCLNEASEKLFIITRQDAGAEFRKTVGSDGTKTLTGIFFTRSLFEPLPMSTNGLDANTEGIIRTISTVFLLTQITFHELLHALQFANARNKSTEGISIPKLFFNALQLKRSHLRMKVQDGYRRIFEKVSLPFKKENSFRFFEFANEMAIDGMTERYVGAAAENIVVDIVARMGFDTEVSREIARELAPGLTKEYTERSVYSFEKHVAKELSKSISSFIRNLPADSNHRIVREPAYKLIRAQASDDEAAYIVEFQLYEGSITGDTTWLSMIKDVYGSEAYAIFARLPLREQLLGIPKEVIEVYYDVTRKAYAADTNPDDRNEALVELALLLNLAPDKK